MIRMISISRNFYLLSEYTNDRDVKICWTTELTPGTVLLYHTENINDTNSSGCSFPRRDSYCFFPLRPNEERWVCVCVCYRGEGVCLPYTHALIFLHCFLSGNLSILHFSLLLLVKISLFYARIIFLSLCPSPVIWHPSFHPHTPPLSCRAVCIPSAGGGLWNLQTLISLHGQHTHHQKAALIWTVFKYSKY